jgi:glycosyltransferase involved in cell wall biosynthesis
MTVRVFISPNYKHEAEHVDRGGIKQVVLAENKYLEQFGVESVANIEEADVIQNHGSMQTWRKGIPVVNSSHGLYWSRYQWGEGIQEVNKELMRAMSMSVAQTAPSEWVARAIRRGALIYPEVVLHGIDADEFSPGKYPGNYVLYNKLRQDFVSDSSCMQEVAKLLPEVQFLTTVGNPTGNVKVIGAMSYDKMKPVIESAEVYLSTTRETFGIGTLEALASGVPVAGFAWGGNSEIIIQGETGYLAPPGRFDILADCIKQCIDERKRLSANCVNDARMRWKWEPRIKQYADIFKAVHEEYNVTKRDKVTVIITAYNLDKYLPKCLDTVKTQTLTDFECLVIDDAQLPSTEQIVNDYAKDDKRFKYIPTPENLGLPGARNFGFLKSHGRYIRHLDADDWLSENALALEAEALDNDPFIHIAYGHLAMVEHDGTVPMVQGSPKRADWPKEKFSWVEQMAHLNQLPSCVMMRREVLQRSGGYRIRCKRQEDAEFWCRVTSLGFRAKKVTEAITYFHRQRNDSKGQKEWDAEGQEPDWTAWFPWSLGAKDYRRGVEALRKYNGMHPYAPIVPFGAQGTSPEGKFWYVHDYAYPSVSVIITCGPGHKEYLIDALDSVQAQTYPDWECIVVNDTGVNWGKYIPGAPWAKLINMDGNQGTAAARNEGFQHIRARYVIWLDADDYWFPWYLERMVAYAEQNPGVIFSDFIEDNGKEKKIYKYENVKYEEIPFHMSYAGSSILIPWEIVHAVNNIQGGYDKEIPGMEDWDFQIAVHHLGFCAHHLPEPLFIYRTSTSTKRERDYAKIEDIRAYLDIKWTQYRKEGKKLMCGCSGTRNVTNKPQTMMTSSGNFTKGINLPEGADPNQMVLVEYLGPIGETFSIRSHIDRGINYRFGNNPLHKERPVFLADAYILIDQSGRDGKPLYRIKGVSGVISDKDPSVIVGAVVQ